MATSSNMYPNRSWYVSCNRIEFSKSHPTHVCSHAFWFPFQSTFLKFCKLCAFSCLLFTIRFCRACASAATKDHCAFRNSGNELMVSLSMHEHSSLCIAGERHAKISFAIPDVFPQGFPTTALLRTSKHCQHIQILRTARDSKQCFLGNHP